jgi:hypothetical protein
MARCFPSTVKELALILLASPVWFVAMIGFASAAANTDPERLTGIDQVPFIFDIAVDPTEENSILLATQEGLYRVRDDGTAERISRKKNPFWNITIEPKGMNRIYARGLADDVDAAGIVVSSDRGRSWRGITPAGEKNAYLRLIEASKATSGSIYGAGHELWKSSDGGMSWKSIGIPPSRIIDLATSASDAQRIFAATMSGLYVSSNGGLSWRPTGGTRCRQPVMAVDTSTDSTVYAFSLCAGLVRGDEVTETWTVVNDRFGGCIIQHLAVDPRNSEQVYAVLGCRKVLVSVDGGLNWSVFGSQRAWEPDCVTNSTGYPGQNSS